VSIYQTPPCPVCGLRSEMTIPAGSLARWRAGEYVQDVFPDMHADDRELLVSGTHPACWDSLFGEEES